MRTLLALVNFFRTENNALIFLVLILAGIFAGWGATIVEKEEHVFGLSGIVGVCIFFLVAIFMQDFKRVSR